MRLPSLKTLLAASALALAASTAGAQDAPKVAVDLTTLTSPFWTSYNKYIVEEAKAQGIDLLRAVQLRVRHGQADHRRAERDPLGAKGIIFSPFDSAAAGTVLKTAREGRGEGGGGRRGADDRAGRDRGARQQRRLRREGLPVHRRACRRGPGRADHGRPGLDQRARPRQRLPRLHHQELPEAQAAGDPDQGLVGRGRGGRARHRS